ncbi:MAG: flavodoxin domain-containing protein [Anaerolineae bacterium]
MPEAMQFIRSHQLALRQKPFAAFVVCMTLAMKNGENYRSHVATFLDPISVLVKPVSKGLFAGVLNLSKITSWSTG